MRRAYTNLFRTVFLACFVSLLFSSCTDFLTDVKEELAIPVTGVSLNLTSRSIVVGGTVKLTATVSPSNADNTAVTWSSSDVSVATVSSSGLVTGVNVGSVTITAKTVYGGYTASCAVEVHSGILDMVFVNGGTFNNGTADMTVSSFYIGKYEITQGLYAAIIGTNPVDTGYLGYGDEHPVYQISWVDAVKFCNALSAIDGYENVYTINGDTITADFTKNGYRLPTEAEWEFAARGGNSTHGYSYAGSNTIADVAWYGSNSVSMLHVVGTKAANELGLYDMSGNVSEYCYDYWGDYPASEQTDYTGPSPDLTTARITRGGCYWSTASECQVSYRSSVMDQLTDNQGVGFRVVRSNISGVSIVPSTAAIGIGGTVTLTAKSSSFALASDAVTWSSSNPSVATVSATGLVTGVNLGSATITVTTNIGGYTTSCEVTVMAAAELGDMVLVAGGTFDNGIADMTVSSFNISKYEVTQKLYTDLMGSNPVSSTSIYGHGDNYPVYNVSWYNAVAFCNALSAMHGYANVYTISGTTVTADFTKNGYRLPTEAEWEFAARGGTKTHGYTYAGSDTLGEVAWYENNADNTSHPMGTKPANELGLFDMSGNITEWCHDWYGGYPDTARTDYKGVTLGTARVNRGGSWRYSWGCEVSTRGQQDPSSTAYMGDDLGFRVARNSDTGTAVTGVSITPSSKIFAAVGGTAQLTANIIPFHATNPAVTWTSSDPSVASVSTTGLVTAVSAGNATITAQTVDGGFTANCTVKVIIPTGSMSMVPVDGGTFNNQTVNMTVSAFLIGTYEVTQKQYTDTMGTNPVSSSSTYGYGDNYPVYYVSWYNAVAFCNALSASDGLENVYTISGTDVTADFSKNGYRLPTEAEWEFAARGGNSTHGYAYSGSNTFEDVGWFSYNSSYTTHVVGTRSANELGTYDMSGNVAEWCHDWFGDYPASAQTDYPGLSSGTYRVMHGGGFTDSYYDVLSRSYQDPASVYFLGFRVVRAH